MVSKIVIKFITFMKAWVANQSIHYESFTKKKKWKKGKKTICRSNVGKLPKSWKVYEL